MYDSPNYGRRVMLFPEITPVVKVLLIINGVVFFFTYISRSIGLFLISNFSLIPAAVTHDFQAWRLLTYIFLHGSFTHILFNMLFLWWFGSDLEKFWGPKLFLQYFLVTGIGGGLFHLVEPNSFVPVIGASGATMGILMAYGLIWPNRTVLLWFIIPVKMKWLVIFSLGISFMGAIQPNESLNVAHLAHLGGMVVGFIYLHWNKFRWKTKDYFYRKKKGKKRQSYTVIDGEKEYDFYEYMDDDDDDYTVH